MFSVLHDAGSGGLTTEQWYDRARAAGLGTSRAADLYDFRGSLKAKGLVASLGAKAGQHKESAMSNNNNERRELTAAELDMVGGGLELAAAQGEVISSDQFFRLDHERHFASRGVACDGIGA